MSKNKLGRPTNDPKVLNTRVRLSQEDIDKLDLITKKLNITKSEVIRMGIDNVYNEIKK